ncbi:GNAT family N-acetyltransferase [Pedobacter deserti]|uniref:GNAT family N-acetyltransferase n=1 Tax=Pedobacter deserti TaxID=2817382 RepID=UPI00210D81CF|nr:GNAT family N-acetyltransferase [Pedobacter sp. SYSU D00382]
MEYNFREASPNEIDQIWAILDKAIERRKAEGSEQWQDGYPNMEVVRNDISKQAGYVLTEKDQIVGYVAVLVNDEPAYDNIEGKWLSTGDFVVIHRVGIAESHLGRGLARQMLEHIARFAAERNIHSIKADTNFDNPAMIRTFENAGYVYCGEVLLRGKSRRAYEKVLHN